MFLSIYIFKITFPPYSSFLLSFPLKLFDENIINGLLGNRYTERSSL